MYQILTEEQPFFFLSYIFRENTDLFIMLGECDSPYPTIHLTSQDWKMAFTKRATTIVKADDIVVCHAQAVDEGIISAFCTYFVFNLAYPRHLKEHPSVPPKIHCKNS
ncbi:hypothetical protein CHARACLAT_025041 [Characodon lateralis]|uniref:Uncharacterized protein n=1 Tax=Characodon lateralis TaxID=208331 RepID=A0ABU7F6A8_9TELE|nr:hypothetical protein [Characodon lateralis]